MITLIKRIDLSPDYVTRLQQVILTVIDKADGRREFRAYCQLGRKIQSPNFLEELNSRITLKQGMIAIRARWVLEACLKK